MIKLTCIECGLTDTLDKFIKDKRAAHGHRNKCRECERSNFERVVEYLAELNGLTVGEYQEFVFWCFENKREVDEITEENRDSLELWLRTKDAA